MKKLIEIEDTLYKKLEDFANVEGVSVKTLINRSIFSFVKKKEKEHLKKLLLEEKEDLGLLFFMQQADRTNIVSKEEILKITTILKVHY